MDAEREDRSERESSPAKDGDSTMTDDKQIEAMKARLAEMEKDAQKLREMNAAQAEKDKTNAPAGMSDEEREAVDSRSIYVGNVSPAHFLVLDEVG